MNAIIKNGAGKPAEQQGFKLASIEELKAQNEEITMIAQIFGIEGKELRHLRQAYFYSTIGNGLVPDVFKGDYRSIYIMGQIAEEMKCTLVEVLQGAYFVHGRFAWYAEFMIKRVMALGIFTTFAYETGGKLEDDTLWARAVATWPNGEKVIGTTVSMRMAKAEGWFDKKGSKWQTMPALMLKKRAATFLIRESAPHVFGGAGTLTVEESEDIEATAQNPQVIQSGNQTDASLVMATIVREERQGLDEQQRIEVRDRVEAKISERIRAGADPTEIEAAIGMSLDAVNDLNEQQLMAVYSIVNKKVQATEIGRAHV